MHSDTYFAPLPFHHIFCLLMFPVEMIQWVKRNWNRQQVFSTCFLHAHAACKHMIQTCCIPKQISINCKHTHTLTLICSLAVCCAQLSWLLRLYQLRLHPNYSEDSKRKREFTWNPLSVYIAKIREREARDSMWMGTTIHSHWAQVRMSV